ncbi:MAG: hypothetical protein ABIN39_02480 [candidate division WOR-3 bacterium]
MIKNILLLFFLIISSTLNAYTFIVFSFNQNLLKENEFLIYSDDKFLSLSFDSLKNTSFIAVFDFSYRAKMFWGPTKISYEDKILYFDFNENILFTFNQLNELENDVFLDDTTLAKASFVNNLKDLNNVMYGIFQLNHNEKDFYFFSCAYEKNDILKTYFDIKNYYEEKNFDSLKTIFKRLHKIYPNNKDFFQFYILSLLDCAEFNEAYSYMDTYLIKFDDDTFYYSIKGNIQAIWGNLEKAKNYFEKGRKKYPESLTLLNDILNVYSITDSLKFDEYKNYLDLKLKR